MATLQELANHKRTDKNCEGGHNYFDVYEALFGPLRSTKNTVLEIGIDKGGSIKLWFDFFEQADIVGIDVISPNSGLDDIINLKRVRTFFETDAYSLDFFESKLLNKVQCDVLIDDGPHTLASMMQFIVMYSKLLSPNGVLIVEDVQNIEWIDALRSVVPDHLRDFIAVYDLRHVANRSDDILFVINKNQKIQTPQICVGGIGGLGNMLYQIACAITYCEQNPKATIVLQKHQFETGTANSYNREQALRDDVSGVVVPYNATIFSKFCFVDTFPKKRLVFENHYSSEPIAWNCQESHLEIAGYQQHRDLFVSTMHSWPKYFNLYNKGMVKRLVKHYAPKDTKPNQWMQTDPRKWFEECVCIGIRRGNDFNRMTAITNRVINRVKKEFYPNHKALIVSDVGNADPLVKDDEALDFDFVVIQEPDIVQLNLAFLCHAMILSESTFHAWLAYFMETAQSKTDITCFNNTDITRRNLSLANWRHVDL